MDVRRPRAMPLIALVEKVGRLMRADMLHAAQARGHADLQPAHQAVLATLPSGGARSADMAARAGVTRQSMGEVVRDMVARGWLEMAPDPEDRRAKLARFTERGRSLSEVGFDRIAQVDAMLRGRWGEDAVDLTRAVLADIPAVLALDAEWAAS